MDRPSRSYDLLWLSLGLLPLVGFSFMLSIPAQDFWWYLRLGREILEAGAVPLVDTLGYSRAGQPIYYQQWLSGLLFWLVYRLGGIPLTYLLRGASIGLAYGMLWWMMRRSAGPRLASALIVLLGAASSSNWVVRPQLFAYPLFILCLWAVHRWQDGRNRRLFLLPLCTVLWVNLHGSFILPFLLAGSALVFGRGERKALALAMGLMLAATCINPYGLGVWKYVAFILNSPSDYLFSVEWSPPRNVGWQLNTFFAWLLAFAPLAAFSKRKLTPLEWAWFLGFGWLALSGIRYGIWFLFLLALYTAQLLADWTNRTIDWPVQRVNAPLNYSLAACLLLAPLAILPGPGRSWWKDAPPLFELSTTPVGAVDWLAGHAALPGPIWNDYAFGSYLEHALPARPTWIDTRMYHYPLAQWEEYVRVSRGEGWREVFDREGVNLLLLSTISQSKLVDAVSASPLWCEGYRDEYAAVFSRCEPVR
jgi:hypothetical protein